MNKPELTALERSKNEEKKVSKEKPIVTMFKKKDESSRERKFEDSSR